MRGILVAALMLVLAGLAARDPAYAAPPAGTEAAPAVDESKFVGFVNTEGFARRPKTADDFRKKLQETCGDRPLRQAGGMSGETRQSKSSNGVCAIIVLACKSCMNGKFTYTVAGVEGIVVGDKDMAATNEMLTSGFGRLFRVLGDLCGDYRFKSFSEKFIRSEAGEDIPGDTLFVAAMFGEKDYRLTPGPDGQRDRLVGSAIPPRYFDVATYRTQCKRMNN